MSIFSYLPLKEESEEQKHVIHFQMGRKCSKGTPRQESIMIVWGERCFKFPPLDPPLLTLIRGKSFG